MNENEAFIPFSVQNICRICLKTTSYLYLMSEDLASFYRDCVDVVNEANYMQTCSLCNWMLRKLYNFKRQCRHANDLLMQAVYMDKKSPIQGWTNINMVQTQTHTHSYIPSDIFEQNEGSLITFNDETDLNGCQTTKKNNTFENDDDKCDVIVYDNSNMVSNDDGINVMMDDDVFDDNDEIPLVLLKCKKKSKKKKNSSQLMSRDAIKDTRSQSELKQKPKQKTKKELRDGFTSRMVQETNEYFVIKLTKEQVLKEMAERSKTDAYIRYPYRCDGCVKGFNFEDVLQKHLEKHSLKNGNFKCDMCGQNCPSAVSLRGHIKSHTTRYKCKLCGQIRLSRQHLLEHHAISHTNAPTLYKCDFCQFTSNKRTVIQSHVRRHGSGSTHACHKCGKLFKSIDALRLHTVRHDVTSRYSCQHCGATFVYASLLRRHEKCVHERREYYCVECDVQFNSAGTLKLHFKKAKKHRDSSAYKYACPHCPERFFTRASLSVHLTSTHDLPKTHACDLCARLYSSRDAVRVHMWRSHRDKIDRKNSLKSKVNTCETHAKTFQSDLQNNHKKEDNIQYENKIEE